MVIETYLINLNFNRNMKKLIFALAILTMVSCSTKPKVNYPYAFVDTKSELVGNNENKMELYVISGNPNLDTLKMFCTEKKESMNSGVFHYIVFFDSKENAVFPNNPMTAFYGVDEKPQKHIKAYFEYNVMNGYCKLNVYETNSWESTATVIDL